MDSNESESCGRCAMTSVVETTQAGEKGDDGYTGAHIEIDEDELRIASAPAVIAGRVKQGLNELATKLVYGR